MGRRRDSGVHGEGHGKGGYYQTVWAKAKRENLLFCPKHCIINQQHLSEGSCHQPITLMRPRHKGSGELGTLTVALCMRSVVSHQSWLVPGRNTPTLPNGTTWNPSIGSTWSWRFRDTIPRKRPNCLPGSHGISGGLRAISSAKKPPIFSGTFSYLRLVGSPLYNINEVICAV